MADINPWATGILSLLLAVSARWKSVVLDLPGEIEHGSYPLIYDAPRALENIQIILQNEPFIIERRYTLSMFLHSSPLLRTVSWDCDKVLLPFRQMEWASIVHLTLSSTQHLPDLLAALSHCKLLETLILHFQSEMFEFNTTLPVIQLPRLQHLAVGSFIQFNVMFSSLILPSLNKLAFFHGLDETPAAQAWIVIQDLITRSSCSLKHMLFCNVQVGDENEYATNLKTPNFLSLDCLQLVFFLSYSKVQFVQKKCGSTHSTIRSSIRNNEALNLTIEVPKDSEGKAAPYSMGCAVRYAFAFEAEHKSLDDEHDDDEPA